MTDVIEEGQQEEVKMNQKPMATVEKVIGHAYHQNLPSNYIDDDGISKVTKYADRKARAVIRLVHSIHLTEEMFNVTSAGDSYEDEEMNVDFDDVENENEQDALHNDTLVSFFLINTIETKLRVEQSHKSHVTTFFNSKQSIHQYLSHCFVHIRKKL